MAPEEVVSWYRRQSKTWLVFECALPALSLLLIWPIAVFFVKGIEHPFLSVFSAADLTVFAALLCLGIFTEFDGYMDRGYISKEKFHTRRNLALVVAIVLFLFFGMMKTAVLSHDSVLSDNGADQSTLWATACTSILSALLAVMFCLSMRWKIIEGMKVEEQ